MMRLVLIIMISVLMVQSDDNNATPLSLPYLHHRHNLSHLFHNLIMTISFLLHMIVLMQKK